SVNENSVEEIETILVQNGYEAFRRPIGKMLALSDKAIMVR
ncbi:MAG: hypothetical protein JWQ09_4671, partial [Segetibacter sp.]|nr:hypothetical protein [Segetibacter sp.]